MKLRYLCGSMGNISSISLSLVTIPLVRIPFSLFFYSFGGSRKKAIIWAICSGVSVCPSSMGIRDVFRSVRISVRLRKRVRSKPPGSLRVMLVGDSDAITPTRVSPLCVLATTVSYPELTVSEGKRMSLRIVSGAR